MINHSSPSRKAVVLMTPRLSAATVAMLTMLVMAAATGSQEPKSKPTGKPKKTPSIGYDDTPFLPGGRWRVHDVNRSRPRVVTPGSAGTPQTPGRAPSDALVLFDGSDLTQWRATGRKENRGKLIAPQWKIADGYMEVTPGSGSIFTKQEFGDCQIHVEWASPHEVTGGSQGRGNSGILIMGKYEIQVLDSYENVSYADGQAASIYGQYPPLVNASRKPGQWQTYDIVFEAPRFDGEELIKPAYVTVLHNGVVVHHRKRMLGPMRHKFVAEYAPHPPQGPLMLQAHGNPVRYRNIWVRPLGDYDQP